jgi:hypothetical protein
MAILFPLPQVSNELPEQGIEQSLAETDCPVEGEEETVILFAQ